MSSSTQQANRTGVATPIRGRLSAAVVVLALAGSLAMAGAADAAVSFDRAFGIGVDTGAAGFENCTTASSCQIGTASGAAGGMNGANGVAVDAQGRIIVADMANNRVDRFVVAGDGTVSFDRAFGIGVDTGAASFENCTTASSCQAGTASGAAGGMWIPSAVAVDAKGRILVTDVGNQRVDRFSVAGDGTVSFDRAFGINLDPSDGDTGDFENCTTTSSCQAGTASPAAGGMSSPIRVAVDAQDRIVVSDNGNERVDRFTVAGDGTVSFERAFGIGVDTGAAGFENCTAASTCQAGTASAAAGGMSSPTGIAVDAQSRILVADFGNNRVDRFTVGGDGTVSFDRAFGVGVDSGAASFENCTTASSCQSGTSSDAAGGMSSPTGVALDAQGRILVADQGNERVDRFTVAGDGTVSFDVGFGIGVDTGAASFENCTTASSCQAGTASGAAGGMNGPEEVAADAQGRMLVADAGNNRIDRFSGPTVSFDRAFESGLNCTSAMGPGFGCAGGTAAGFAGYMADDVGVAVDGQGRILVADTENNRIDRLTVAGDGTISFDRAFGIGVATGGTSFENCTSASSCRAGSASNAPGGMSSPNAVAVDAQGRILVADTANDRIDRFTVAGDGTISFDRAFGVSDPLGVAVDAQGGILVTDAGNERVDRFTVAGDGTVSFDRAFGIGVDTGAFSFENCTTASGCQGGTQTGAAGGMGTPFGIAVDAQGRILVADPYYNRVDRFSVAGDGTVSFDRAFGINVDPSDGDTGDFENCTTVSGCEGGTASGLAGGMNQPSGITVDAQGRILVADNGNNRIDRFSTAGDGTVGFDRAFGLDVDPSNGNGGAFENCTAASTCQTGTSSGADGGMNSPEGVVVDGQGRIVVADSGNNRIDRFSGPKVTVTNVVVPATDPGTFDLRVGTVVVRAGATNGQSGSLHVPDGVDVTVSEHAVNGELSDYDTTIDCGNGPKPGTSLTLADVATDASCTITNSRKPSSGGGPGGGAPSGGPGGGPAPGGGPGIDTTPPVFGSASLTNRSFAVDKSGPAETAVAARAKKGTVFGYTLSESARVVFTIERVTPGRKVGRACRSQTRKNRKRHRCTRYVSAGRFAQQSAAGANRHPFSGRIGRRALKPGNYRATLVATDAAGNHSAPRRLNFKVVSASQRRQRR